MNPADIEAYVDAAAAALALPLQVEHRPGVLAFFALAADFAALVDGVPLDVRAEPAAHFLPIAPSFEPDA